MVPQNKSEFNPIQDRLGREGGGEAKVPPSSFPL